MAAMHITTETTPTPPLAVTVQTARRLSGLGRTKIFELIGTGELESIAIGRRRLIRYSSLEALLGK